MTPYFSTIAIAAVLIQAATGILPDKQPKPVTAPTHQEIAAALPMPPVLAPLEMFAPLPDLVPVPLPRPSAVKKPASVRKPKPAKIHRQQQPPVRAVPARPTQPALSFSIRISL